MSALCMWFEGVLLILGIGIKGINTGEKGVNTGGEKGLTQVDLS